MRAPSGYLFAAALAGIPFLFPAAATALPVQGAAALSNAPEAMVEQVQWRRDRWRGRDRHRHYDRRGYGGVGAGLAAGAIIGGAIAASQAQAAAANADAYCFQRYKSYDPASGTYLGYDGYRHPCP